MKDLNAHEILTLIIKYLTGIWGLILVPLIVFTFSILSGHGGFAAYDELSWRILYLNLLAFPVMIILCVALSWIMLQKQRYGAAVTFILLPLVNVFIELLAVDFVVFFTT